MGYLYASIVHHLFWTGPDESKPDHRRRVARTVFKLWLCVIAANVVYIIVLQPSFGAALVLTVVGAYFAARTLVRKLTA